MINNGVSRGNNMSGKILREDSINQTYYLITKNIVIKLLSY